MRKEGMSKNLLRSRWDGLTAKRLMAHFGLIGSASQRAEPILRAVGADPRAGRPDLGDARYLLGSVREKVVRLRDRYRQA